MRWLMCIALLTGIAGCGEIAVQSVWRSADVAVDGNGVEWDGRLRYLEHASAAVGVCNDNEALYVGVVPWNHDMQARVTGTGCVFKFGAVREDDERFGLHVQFGDIPAAMKMLRDVSRTETVALIRELSTRLDDIEVLDANDKVIAHVTCDDAASQGVEFAVGEYKGRLLIEARIPYGFVLGGESYHVNDDLAVPIELVLETPTLGDLDSDRNPLALPAAVTGNYDSEASALFATQLQATLEVELALVP